MARRESGTHVLHPAEHLLGALDVLHRLEVRRLEVLVTHLERLEVLLRLAGALLVLAAAAPRPVELLPQPAVLALVLPDALLELRLLPNAHLELALELEHALGELVGRLGARHAREPARERLRREAVVGEQRAQDARLDARSVSCARGVARRRLVGCDERLVRAEVVERLRVRRLHGRQLGAQRRQLDEEVGLALARGGELGRERGVLLLDLRVLLTKGRDLLVGGAHTGGVLGRELVVDVLVALHVSSAVVGT